MPAFRNKKMATGLKRDTKDAFFTVPAIAKACIDAFHEHVRPSPLDIVIEPSAGSGAFSLQTKCDYAFDIDPQHPSIKKQDFLNLENDVLQKIQGSAQKVHVIGNPPFGRQSGLARRFIKKSAEFASSISFILPKSFKKESFQKAFPLHFHLVHELDLPDDAFLIDGKRHHVPCVFQIWVKQNTERPRPLDLKPEGFAFCKKQDHPDLAIRRVGIKAGAVFVSDIQRLSEQSHYFVKLSGLSLGDFTTWSSALPRVVNTVGPRSISKQEILMTLVKSV